MRLHLGCGRAYLRDWVNVDLPGPNVVVAGQVHGTYCGMLRNGLETDEAAYYEKIGKTPDRVLADGPEPDREKLVDVAADLRHLPFGPESADEILAVQVLEHFAVADRGAVLDHWFALLKPGGLLRLTVPDTDECVRRIEAIQGCEQSEEWEYFEGKFALRHLLGSRKDAYSYHLSAFTRDGLEKILLDWGFYAVSVESEPSGNFAFTHDYPALYAVARRPVEYMTRAQYQDAIWGGWGLPPQHGGDRKVVDIGGGMAPHPRADLVVDNDLKWKESVERERAFQIGDVRDLPFADKQFDFAICSHVLEHMPDASSVRKACSELQRIAKAGYIETPNRAKELFVGTPITQQDHNWWVDELPHGRGLRFTAIQPHERAKIAVEFEAAMSRILRLSSTPTRDERAIRKHFWRSQRLFNACLVWKDHFDVEVEE